MAKFNVTTEAGDVQEIEADRVELQGASVVFVAEATPDPIIVAIHKKMDNVFLEGFGKRRKRWIW